MRARQIRRYSSTQWNDELAETIPDESTVDPERDTQEVLAQYVPAFDKRFLGLRGDLQQTEKVAKEFKVFYQKVPGKQPGSYTMDHTAGSYVFDPQGRIRLFVKHGQGPQTLAHDIKLLLS